MNLQSDKQFIKANNDLFLIKRDIKPYIGMRVYTYEVLLFTGDRKHYSTWKRQIITNDLWSAYDWIHRYTGERIITYMSYSGSGFKILSKKVKYHFYRLAIGTSQYTLTLESYPMPSCTMRHSEGDRIKIITGESDKIPHYATYSSLKKALEKIEFFEGVHVMRKDGSPYEKYIVSRY